MLELLFLVILLILASGIGGLLFLVWLPFSNWLLKKGKLTAKQNNKINRAYVLLWLCLIAFAFYNRDYRTPSKDRLEASSKIKLPESFRVLKDEYHDAGWHGDYSIEYIIELDRAETKELIKRIKKSKYYNPILLSNEPDVAPGIAEGKAIWYRSNIGYHFSLNEKRCSYFITLDTTKHVLEYKEIAF